MFKKLFIPVILLFVTVPLWALTVKGSLDVEKDIDFGGAITGDGSGLTGLPTKDAGFTYILDFETTPETGIVSSDIYMPFAATITGVTVFCDATGSETIGNITLDIQKTTYASYPADSTISDTGITVSFSGASYGKAQKTGGAVAEWISNTALAAGDILRIYISAITNVDRFRLSVKMEKQ